MLKEAHWTFRRFPFIKRPLAFLQAAHTAAEAAARAISANAHVMQQHAVCRAFRLRCNTESENHTGSAASCLIEMMRRDLYTESGISEHSSTSRSFLSYHNVHKFSSRLLSS